MTSAKEETLYWVEGERGAFDKPMSYLDACRLAEDHSWDTSCVMWVRKDGAFQPEVIYYHSYKYVPDVNQTTGRRA